MFMAGVTGTGVTSSAGVAFSVMIAVEIPADLQSSCKQSLHHFPDIALGSSDKFDPGNRERMDRSRSDSAADEKIHFGSCKHC